VSSPRTTDRPISSELTRRPFEFPPKAEVQTLIATHDKGFAQIQTDKLPADGKIALQPWGHITGVVKVGPKVDPGQIVVLQSFYHRYGEEGETARHYRFIFEAAWMRRGISFQQSSSGTSLGGPLLRVAKDLRER